MIEAENIVFFIEGGLGKNIMASAVIRNIKQQNPDKKLIVICSYPDVFMYNPYIHRVYGFGQHSNFYEEWVNPAHSHVIKVEPYIHPDYILKKKHLIECWCEQVGVKCNNIRPEIFLTAQEKSLAMAQISMAKKPPLLMQICGGKNPAKNTMEEWIKAETVMHRRNMPMHVAEKVIEGLSDKFNVLQVKSENQPLAKGANPMIVPNIRAIFSYIPLINHFLCIDSFLMHACAAFSKKPVVCWGGTSPAQLGYSDQINITKIACPTPFCHRPNSYLFDIMPNGQQWDCPHGEPCLEHDPADILRYFDTSKIALPVI